jgi:hypothetical protein
MAIITAYDAQILIGPTGTSDFSAYCKKVTVDDGQETREATAFSNTYRVYRPGLGTPSIEATFYNDQADNSLNEILRAFISVSAPTTTYNVVVRYQAGTARGASNPVWTMTGAMLDGSLLALDDAPGEIPEITVKWLPYGTFSVSVTACE